MIGLPLIAAKQECAMSSECGFVSCSHPQYREDSTHTFAMHVVNNCGCYRHGVSLKAAGGNEIAYKKVCHKTSPTGDVLFVGELAEIVFKAMEAAEHGDRYD